MPLSRANNFDVIVELKLLHGQSIVLDPSLVEALKLIDKEGSLLAASRRMGVTYSWIWEKIRRAELILGEKLVIRHRGGYKGGGARLTPLAKKLLKSYERACDYLLRSQHGSATLINYGTIVIRVPELTVIGSHDIFLEYVLRSLREEGFRDLRLQWVGSLKGMAATLLGEADIAGVHLYDPIEKSYNIPYVKRLHLSEEVVLIRGYYRELVFAFKNEKFSSIDEVLQALACGRARIANRNKGSGTRLFLVELLKLKGLNPNMIRGFETEYLTHYEAALAVAHSRADVALVIRAAAEKYGLRTLHVTWEYFDFIARKSSLKKETVQSFIRKLRRSSTELASLRGYRPCIDSGEIIIS